MRRLIVAFVLSISLFAPGWAADYIDLHDLHSNADLRARVEVAIIIAAQAIFEEASPTTTRLAWAQEAIGSPKTYVNAAYFYILAANKTATIVQITGAPDTGAGSIQLNVDAWRDKIYP